MTNLATRRAAMVTARNRADLNRLIPDPADGQFALQQDNGVIYVWDKDVDDWVAYADLSPAPSGDGSFDTITEFTPGHGVDVDGVLLKDGNVTAGDGDFSGALGVTGDLDVAGTLTGVAGNFTGTLTGVAGNFTGLLTAASLLVTGPATFNGDFTIAAPTHPVDITASYFNLTTEVGGVDVVAKTYVSFESFDDIDFIAGMDGTGEFSVAAAGGASELTLGTGIDLSTSGVLNLNATGGVVLTGALSVTNLTVTGNTALGDATTDRITGSALIDRNWSPTDALNSLGDASNRWIRGWFSSGITVARDALAGTGFYTGITFQSAATGVTGWAIYPVVAEAADAGYNLLVQRSDSGGDFAWLTVVRDTGAWTIVGDGTVTGSLAVTTRVTTPLLGTTTAVDLVLDRNSVPQLTLGSLAATFAGTLTVAGASISVGGTPATAGALRLTNNTSITGRNAANTQNINLVTLDGSNNITIGGTNGGNVLLNNGGTDTLTVASATATFGTSVGVVLGNSGYLQLGTTAPATGNGMIRARNNVGIMAVRNAANTLNYQALLFNSSNVFEVGTSAMSGVRLSATGGPWDLTGGNWVPGTNNGQDIGTASFTVRSLYLGTSLVVPEVLSPIVDSGSATDLILQRNNVTQLTLGSLTATFAGIVSVDGDQVIVGRAASSFSLVDLVTADTATSEIRFRFAANTRMTMRMAATTANVQFLAYDAAGAFQDTWMQANNAANSGVSINRPVSIGIIGNATPTTGVIISRTLTGGTSHVGLHSVAVYDSTATGAGYGVRAKITTQAAAFTMASAVAFHANSPTIGAGSAITNLYGLFVESQTGATNNFAIKTQLGIVEFGDVVRPDLANTRDFGSASLTWRTGYFGTEVVTPSVDSGGAVDLVLQRNNVTQLTLASLAATFAGSVTANAGFIVNATVGTNGLNFQDTGVNRLIMRLNSTTNWVMGARDGAGASIDSPIDITLAAGGTIAFGPNRPTTWTDSTATLKVWVASTIGRIETVGAHNLRLGTNNTARWEFQNAGHLVPMAASYNVGSTATPLGNLYTLIVDSGTATDLVFKRATVTQLTLGSLTATFAGTVSATQVTSTIAIGTAPLVVTSTTKVTNLNADLLDDQEGSYYLALANATGTLGATLGGTGQSTWTLGDLLYASAANTLSKLAGNTTTTPQYLRQTGTGTASAAPVWDTLTAADVGAGIFSGSSYTVINGLTANDIALGTTSGIIKSTLNNLELHGVAVIATPNGNSSATRIGGDSSWGTGAYIDLWGTAHANAGRLDIVSGGTADLNLTAGSGLVKVTTDLQVASGKVYKVNGTQVVTSRRTGYTNAMTGTKDRATAYDTTTITLPQLAARVGALLDDLTTHGLIGV